jgi:hypothetical protein
MICLEDIDFCPTSFMMTMSLNSLIVIPACLPAVILEGRESFRKDSSLCESPEATEQVGMTEMKTYSVIAKKVIHIEYEGLCLIDTQK